MSVARITEISATSPSSFDDAVKVGVERASQTLRGITSAWVKDQRAVIEGGSIKEYQVNMQITFILDDG